MTLYYKSIVLDHNHQWLQTHFLVFTRYYRIAIWTPSFIISESQWTLYFLISIRMIYIMPVYHVIQDSDVNIQRILYFNIIFVTYQENWPNIFRGMLVVFIKRQGRRYARAAATEQGQAIYATLVNISDPRLLPLRAACA